METYSLTKFLLDDKAFKAKPISPSSNL